MSGDAVLAPMSLRRFKPTPILRERRKGLLARMTLTDPDGAHFEVMVRDISSRGLSAAALGIAPPTGTVLRAHVDEREVWGLVRWAEGNLFGMEFDTGRR